MGELEKQKAGVHYALSYSYTSFYFGMILGIVLHLFFKYPIFENNSYPDVGFFLILIGTIFVFWAQNTTRGSKDERSDNNQTVMDFYKGPYKFSRSPTHLGLLFMIVGVALLINSLFILVTIFLSFLVSQTIFLDKQDEYLEKKYGESYRQYREKVRRWF
ncbi:isoprenylcysteine carboxylmethyltransferase family protein [Candidatus Nomurabacteria bacterium]|nr:isoprenylcysteine carboxylmethyltransferase family protein [Candidatus Nomurabacteria bacterium]USN94651.1 MAG: isoprenylcysteine carboxylmethyltransferase family protein [Candidatus Nomurabacteria bacterium]